MDYRELVADKLSNFRKWMVAKDNLEEQIEELEAKLTRTETGLDREKVRTVNLIAERDEAKECLEDIKRGIKKVERALALIGKEQREVILLVYGEGYKLSEVADRLGYGVRHVYRLRDQALEEIARAMYGRVQT